MLNTYKAILRNNRLEWIGEIPTKKQPVNVFVTILDDEEKQKKNKSGKRMAEALAKIAKNNPFKDIDDPVKWQREIRQDRELPGREDE